MPDVVQNAMAAFEAHSKSLAEANCVNKTAIFAALTAASIVTVIVQFDGEGDSGQIQEVTAEDASGPVPIPKVHIDMQRPSWNGKPVEPDRVLLKDAIEELCFDYLSQEHGGWENNDGGQGDFTFHVAEQRTELDFNQFYTESTNHTHTF